MNELPSIDRWLVTQDNPPRVMDGMDHERCAALHNYIIQYAWVSSNHHLSDFERQSWFEKHGDEASVIRERLHPSVVKFLETAYDSNELGVSFFYWVSELNDPASLWENWEMFADGGEEYRRLTLYRTQVGLLGSHSDGVCYDQKLHKVVMFISTDDHSFAESDEGAHMCHPLETLLSNWIYTIRIGKITAGPEGVSLDNEKYDPWMYHSYSAQQVEETVASFNRLVIAIESLIPTVEGRKRSVSSILSHKELDLASVPIPSFARSFLATIRLPGFNYIAPGLMLPTPETFVQSQLFAAIKDEDDRFAIPPVLLFRAEGSLEDSLQDSFIFGPKYASVFFHKKVPAGLYTDAISRDGPDTAEEGFRLILPFLIGKNKHARKSTGQLIEPSTSNLYQHGFKPFGGDWSRAQRLVRLFDNWCGMVESGLWAVGERGIEGGIEKFKEADTEAKWKSYWIEPDW